MMKEFKGTPGPWFTVQQYADEVSVIDTDGFKVVTAERTAILMDWDKKGFEHWGDDGGNKHLSGPEQFANAYIIAAAPELLEALRSVIEACSNLGYNGDGQEELYIEVEKAEKVINKALGQ